MDNKFKIQERKYVFPYHHLINFDHFKVGLSMPWGIEYYGYIKKILDIIDKNKFDSLLDVGCGDGKLIFELSKKYNANKIVGVDLCKCAILFAKAFNYDNNSKFYDIDVADLNDSFDIITVIETVEHVSDEELSKFINSLYNRLKPGGILIISVPSKTIPLQKKHYRHYDLDLLVKQFNRFKLEKTYYLIKNGWFYNVMIKFSRKFSSFFMLNKLFLYLGEKLLFNANEKNARHIVCVFRK